MRPMLASAGTVIPGGPEWVHEIKWDGMRVLADVADGRLRLWSRNENDVTSTFPELSTLAGPGMPDDMLLDGEVVALQAGLPSFSALSERMHVSNPRKVGALTVTRPVTFMVFDLLRLGGVDLIAQPLAQIAASVPATALFPVVLLLLIRVGGGLGIGSIVLLLLGTQWYILFNVIAGAIAIPTDLKECCSVFRLHGIERWKKLILPGIFPYLVTGMVTASGGAWNASIVAEYFHFKGHIYTTVGLGATISQATDAGNFHLLLAATMMMAATVVTINRLVWRKLYALAETRYRLET